MKRLRAGMVGGGQGAFIGAVHRIAAELDGEALLVAGALSSNPARARASAEAWGLDRSYDSYEQMAALEAKRDDGIDFAIVAAPNHLHLPVVKAFLESGTHVICDKPLAGDLDQAQQIAKAAAASGRLFALTAHLRRLSDGFARPATGLPVAGWANCARCRSNTTRIG